jgi:O-succinylbenzoate synthase
VLGGSPEAVEVGVTFDRMESIDEFLAAIGRALEAGFPRVKLKLRPGWALEMLRVVRQEFPTQTFHVDCEGSLGLEHMEMLCRLDDFGLAMIEQPLAADDLVGNAMLQEAVRTPICLDEGITTPAQAEMALDLKSCRLVNLKADRVGGLTAAVAIHESCRASDVGCWAGGVPQSAVGQRIALALAATARGVYPADYFPADEVLAVNLAEPSRARRDPTDGRMCVPLWSTPGLGIEPDGEILRKHSLQAVHYAGGAASQASGPR